MQSVCGRGKTNLKLQQPWIGMICIHADLRYTGRFDDDKQGGDTILQKAIALYVELTE